MARWAAILCLLWLSSVAASKTDCAVFLTGMFILLGTQPTRKTP